MLEGSTINSTIYCKIIKEFKKTIKDRRPESPINGFILICDNSTPYAVTVMKDILQIFKYILIQYLSSSIEHSHY